MTVSKDEQFVYNWFGDGKNTTFDFDFLIENESQLAVYFTNTETSQIKLENGIDYTINEIGNENGSFITFPIEGSKYHILKHDEIISISLELPISQDTPYDESEKLVKSRLERNFDYLTKLIAIQSKQIERAVKIREGSQYNPNEVLSIIFESEEKSKLAKENSQVALDSANLAKDIATAAQNQSDFAIETAQNSNNTALMANENSTTALTNANQALNIAINANQESQEAMDLANTAAQKVDVFEQDIQTVIDAAGQIAQLEESVATAVNATSVATNAANEASAAAKNATNAANNATQAVEEALAATQISLNNKLDVNGTAVKATADSNGNNIIATYRTISDSYTKIEVDAMLETKGGGGLEIGDIGIAPLGIDETKGKRRYLNGQVIIQDQYTVFSEKVKAAIALYPSLGCTEDEWQTAVTMSAYGQCGKFVVDDGAGTIRLPKITGFIQGLTDLASLSDLVEAGLPNITGYGADNVGTQIASAYDGAMYRTTTAKSAVRANYNGTATSTDTTAIDASRSNPIYGNSTTVQPESVRYPYFIQVATGTETEADITNELELNIPFFFGMSKYFKVEPNNTSWLKSAGQWNSKALYPSYYDWILTNVNNGVEGFIGNTMYMWGSASGGYMCQTLTPKVGSPIWEYTTKTKVGYVTKVYDTGELDFTDNRANISYTKIGRYSPSDESSNAYITDYDFVINTADETFRLPLLDGSENLVSDKYDELELLTSGSYYTAPANGFYVLQKEVNAANQYIWLQTNHEENNENLYDTAVYSAGSGNVLHVTAIAKKGQRVYVSYTAAGVTNYFRFVYAQGNGSLYYYVGDTAQNPNIVNLGRIEEKLVDKVDITDLVDAGSYIAGCAIPSSKMVAITLGEPGATYTAPANGWIYIAGSSNTEQTTNHAVTVYVGNIRYTDVTYGASMALGVTCPISKGQTFQVHYARFLCDTFKFHYSIGSESEG